MIIDLGETYADATGPARESVSDRELADAVKVLALLWSDDLSDEREIDKAFNDLVELADRWAGANG